MHQRETRAALLLCSFLIGSAAAPTLAAEAVSAIRFDVDLEQLDRASVGDAVRIDAVPVDASTRVTLDLERFDALSPSLSVALGHDRMLALDTSRVRTLRGRVQGYEDSHAFIAVTDYGSLGWIDLGSGGARYAISGRSAGRLNIGRATSGGYDLPVPRCGLEATDPDHGPAPRRTPDTAGAGGGGATGAAGLRRIEVAVETDYELFQLFGDLDAVGAYVVAVYAGVSEIYRRDLDLVVDLAFVRLWDDPDDLFNIESPINEFREYWEKNMTAVHRDVAQFFSGRRNFPYGGTAYFEGLCNQRSYSVSGYALGFFDDINEPGLFHRDVHIAAHEIGHNAGTFHTHDYGIDTCNDEQSAPRRGTIMSYCDQTFTGGGRNVEMRFHTEIQEVIRAYVESVTCLTIDCNLNGIADDMDISADPGLDLNTNGIPDACEDCDDDGTLDDAEIAAGAPDLDGNGIPDACEPDCNTNGIPDALDISSGASTDIQGDGIPDDCEDDCNNTGISDYAEINADMSLDLNRNAILDSCEDCDNDGTLDLVALDHAHDVWIADMEQTSIRSYLAAVGTLVDVSDDALIAEPQDLIITPGRRIFVSSLLDDRILEFDEDGTFLGNLVAPGSGGLDEPAAMTLAANGNLLVVSRALASVLEYDASGTPVGARIAAGAGGLVTPFGITTGPNGNLFVTSGDNRVLEYTPSGTFVGEFVTTADNGGLTDPRGLLFLPSGNLLVASHDTDQLLEYDGTTGAFLRQFNVGGTADRLTLDQPWALRLGPDGDVYVSRTHDHAEDPPTLDGPLPLHLTNARIYQFDVDSGWLVRAYIIGVNSGLAHPTGFAFVPDAGTDCNQNLLPDACDITAGVSADGNANGAPDECESCPLDASFSGAVDFADLLIVLANWGPCPGAGACAGDFDASGAIDFGDLLMVLAAWGPCP